MTAIFVGDQLAPVSGQTGLDSVAAGSGTANTITRLSLNTVVIVTRASAGHNLLKLPADAEVGDVVEVYQDLSLLTAYGQIGVQTPTGENFGDASSGDTQTQVGLGYGARFRKLTETQWGVHGNNNG